ncbi:MAG TPA: shikimate kinase [Candidatus Binataceae bacterium]|nr:shikimate kinase [Candidatus Binataceae bacterium]
MAPKLILTGFMATGKSAVGPLVARRLGWQFVDSDAEIVARAGKPISAIFSERGEAAFRALEREAIAGIAADRRRCAQCHAPRPAVISTGGGALVDESNCAALSRIGVIICLSASPEVIAARVGASAVSRPKLAESAKPLRERIRELMTERAGAYARADALVDTSDLTVDQVVDRVIETFAEKGASRCRPSA